MNNLEQLSTELVTFILLNDLESIGGFTNAEIINHPDILGRYPLLVACERGRYEAVKLLGKAGGNTDIQNEKKQTPLMIAAAWRHEEIVDYLLERFATVDLEDIEGRTAYDYAQKYRHLNIMSKLKERTESEEAKRNAYEKAKNELKKTPKRLLELENQTGEQQYFGDLQTAIIEQDDVALNSLLAKKVKWIWQKHKVFYPLRTAIQHKNYYAFRKLIEHDYLPLCSKLQAEPIELFVAYQAYDLLQYALAEGVVDPNAYCTKKITPLVEAVIRRNVKLLRLLLEYGAYPIQKTETGWDILDLASLPEMVNLLVEYRQKLE